jgi:hypothetical protein
VTLHPSSHAGRIVITLVVAGAMAGGVAAEAIQSPVLPPLVRLSENWNPPAFARPEVCGIVVWQGKAGTGRWSDPENWIGGRTPGACDSVFFGSGRSSSIVDVDFHGSVAGLELSRAFQGALILDRDLKVDGRLALSSGTLEQGNSSLSVLSLIQGGGVILGGGAPLWIEEDAAITGGVLVSPSALMRCRRLKILRPGVLRVGLRGKLEIAGNGEPLTGDGWLDTTTNVPNSVECTGEIKVDVTEAAALKAFPDLAQVGLSLSLLQNEDSVFVSLMDSAAGYVYFGTRTEPAYVVKVRLSDFTRVGALALPLADGGITTGAIDASAGVAYFGTNANPGRVIRVDLGSFTTSQSLTLDTGEYLLTAATIDTGAGYLYLGTLQQPPRVIRIDLNTFTRDSGLVASSTTKPIRCAAIDTTSGYAYFGTGASGDIGGVLKLRLSDFTVVGAIDLEDGEYGAVSAAIDSGNSRLYLGTRGHPGRVVKIDLQTFTRADSLTLESGEVEPTSAIIDTARGFVCFGFNSRPGRVVKIDLSTFSRSSGLILNVGEDYLRAASYEPATGFAYFSGTTQGPYPSKVVRIDTSNLTEAGTISLKMGENFADAAAIDLENGYAYFATTGRIVKIRLADFVRVGAVTYSPGVTAFHPNFAAIDTSAGYAYFDDKYMFPGSVFRIDLSNFTLAGQLSLLDGEDDPRAGVIDRANGFLYVGTYTSPGQVVKIDLNDFSRVGAIALDSGEDKIWKAVIDEADGYACFVTYTSPAQLVKIDLATFSRVGAVTLEAGQDKSQATVIDPLTDMVYVATFTEPSDIVKVDASEMTIVDSVTLPAMPEVASGAIDLIGGAALFGTFSPAKVLRIRLSDLVTTGQVDVIESWISLVSAVLDPVAGYAYFGSSSYPARIVKIGIGSDCRETYALTNGKWKQIALPCEPRTNTVAGVFGDDGMGIYGTDWAMIEHDTATNSYRDLQLVDPLEKNKGYWIRTISGDHIVGNEGSGSDESLPYDIAIFGDEGGLLNMIGHPFISSVDWSMVEVDVGDGVFVKMTSLSDLEATRVFSSQKWEFNGNTYDLCDARVLCDDPSLSSFDGFWIEAYADTTLRIPPAAVDRPTRRRPETDLGPGEWYIRLSAEDAAGGLLDRSNFIGELANAEDGRDSRDAAELPPFGSEYLALVFPHPEWSGEAADLTADFRRLGSEGVWRIELRTDNPREVDLTWQGGGAVGQILERAQLIDVDNGVTIDLSATSTYRLQMAGSVHRLTLDVPAKTFSDGFESGDTSIWTSTVQ